MHNYNTGLCLVMLWRQWGTQWPGKKYLRYPNEISSHETWHLNYIPSFLRPYYAKQLIKPKYPWIIRKLRESMSKLIIWTSKCSSFPDSSSHKLERPCGYLLSCSSNSNNDRCSPSFVTGFQSSSLKNNSIHVSILRQQEKSWFLYCSQIFHLSFVIHIKFLLP